MEETTLSISLFKSLLLLFTIAHCFGAEATPEGTVNHNKLYNLCTVPGYDYFNLTALPWFITTKSPACLPLPNSTSSIGTKVSQCMILMRFCGSLKNFGEGCKNDSICQQSVVGDVSLGAYIDNPFIESHASHEGFQAAIPEGARFHTPDGTPCSLETVVDFYCNSSAKWEAPSVYIGIKKAPDPRSVKYDAATCQMKLSFDYAGACRAKKPEGVTVLSIGSVILIVFSIAIVIYLVLGCTMNVARGHSGTRIIPHAAMWSSLIGYISDGFKFVTCTGTKPMTETSVYEEIKS